MQAKFRDQHYFIYLKPEEAAELKKGSFLESQILDNITEEITGRVLRLSLGGNRKGLEANLKYGAGRDNNVYVTITKTSRNKLAGKESVLAKYDNGTITFLSA